MVIVENNKVDKIFGLRTRKCFACGREFETMSKYVFKRRDNKGKYTCYFCSWSCFNKDYEEQQKKKKYNRW